MSNATLASTREAPREYSPDESIYLSRIFLNARQVEVQKALNDVYRLHQIVALAFGDGEEYKAARVLFRVDDDGKTPLHVLVQSLRAPDWNRLPREYSRGDIAQKEWNPQFQNGQMLSFRLLANVCKRSRDDGKRRGIYSEIEQLQWLARQGERGGFAFATAPRQRQKRDESGALAEETEIIEVPDVSLSMLGKRDSETREYSREARFTRLHATIIKECENGENDLHNAKFCAVRFEGRLHVTDTDAFGIALRSGIGPAKGLGFGLLSPARA